MSDKEKIRKAELERNLSIIGKNTQKDMLKFGLLPHPDDMVEIMTEEYLEFMDVSHDEEEHHLEEMDFTGFD